MTLVTVIILNGYRQFGVMCIGGYVEVRFFNGWVWVGPDRQVPSIGWHGGARSSAMLGSAPYDSMATSIEKFV
jgi:hypothetical protein